MAKKSTRRASKTTSQSARSGPSQAKGTWIVKTYGPHMRPFDPTAKVPTIPLRTSRNQSAQKPASQPKGLKKPSKPFHGVQATQVATPPLKTPCAAVAARREVLFATRKAGAGNAPPKVFRNVRCK